MKLLAISLGALALAAAPAMAGNCSGSKSQQTAAADTARYVYTEEAGTIVDVAAAAGSFETLIAAAKAADLAGALQGDGPLTVFAPTDEAFAALPDGTVEMLLKPENKDQLAGILKLHVIAGAKVTSDQLAGTTTNAETLNGTVEIDGTDGVTVNGANVIAADVMASNGVIHVIDTVLLPEG